jgi:hypothetical protein
MLRISLNLKILCNLPKITNSLKCLYANGNKIEFLPASYCDLDSLKVINCPYSPILVNMIYSCTYMYIHQEINVANNNIKILPSRWIEKWGNYNQETGQLKSQGNSSNCKVTLLGNPINL